MKESKYQVTHYSDDGKRLGQWAKISGYDWLWDFRAIKIWYYVEVGEKKDARPSEKEFKIKEVILYNGIVEIEEV
ncbi:hypothetical protein A2Z67_03730 [Candidatus Woesebacteria bacterium RBG_13_36_22]|uniref:Uncharacterized protein n=1 Tax=Candidatus Woesebacteria bacterium RBG_13_36_22 TaxID=1802478 RepID=A0A1F7WZB3_9BACT|nr:MAG: hypothetical protein A2Z67_03730 [Candidatus Woesebacteria bacterium RBG_13_36_22]